MILLLNSVRNKFQASIGNKILLLIFYLNSNFSFAQNFNVHEYLNHIYAKDFHLFFVSTNDTIQAKKTQLEIQDLIEKNQIIISHNLYKNITQLKGKIAELTKLDSTKIKILILQNYNKNALSFPDGSIILNTGLLQKINCENELAFVLAHEFSHLLQPEIFNKNKVDIAQFEINADNNALDICNTLGYQTQSLSHFVEQLKQYNDTINLNLFKSSISQFNFENKNKAKTNHINQLHYELNNERIQNIKEKNNQNGFKTPLTISLYNENIQALLNDELYIDAFKNAIEYYTTKNDIIPLLIVLERFSYFINIKKNNQLTKFASPNDFTLFIEKINAFTFNKTIHHWLLENEQTKSPKNHEILFYKGLLHYYGKYYNNAKADFLYYKNNFKNEIHATRAEALWREIRNSK